MTKDEFIEKILSLALENKITDYRRIIRIIKDYSGLDIDKILSASEALELVLKVHKSTHEGSKAKVKVTQVIAGSLTIEQGIALINNELISRTELFGVTISTKGPKLRSFSRSIKCALCGLEGVLFRIEKALNDHSTSIHAMNMYAIKEGKEVLMTIDHIVPRSKGGKNHSANIQTMCENCNRFKSEMNLPKEVFRYK